MTFDVWNHGDIDSFLEHAAGKDKVLARLLILALKKPLLSHTPCLIPLKEVPDSSPRWLAEKLKRGQSLYTFVASRDRELQDEVGFIKEWIERARAEGKKWTEGDNPRRLNFTTMKEAVATAGEQHIDLIHAYFEAGAAESKYNPLDGTYPFMKLDGGWKILYLGTQDARNYESACLHHCANESAYEDATLYSLRDENGKPRVTLEVKNNKLMQARGLQNQPADLEMLPHLQRFYEAMHLEGLGEPGLTGLVKIGDTIHSIYDLPENASVDTLDLSWVKKPLVLPEGLETLNLIIRAKHIPCEPDINQIMHDVVLPQTMHVRNTIKFVVKHEGKLHAVGSPAEATYDGFSRKRSHEKYMRLDELHNPDGPAERFFSSGRLQIERWALHNQTHREDGPAYTEYDPATGRVLRELYYEHNKRHNANNDKPSIVYDAKTGRVQIKEWYFKGAPHRVTGEASYIRYSETGHIIEQRWNNFGLLHREHGPAVIYYCGITGRVMKEAWYRHGLPYNPDGPTIVYYDEKGNARPEVQTLTLDRRINMTAMRSAKLTP